MKCQRPGEEWQNACKRPSGSINALSVGANTTPEVPRVRAMIPGSTAPTPVAPAAWSPAPPTTGVPAFNPVSAAAVSLICPLISVPS